MKLKLIQISSDRKAELEKELNHSICPFTTEHVKHVGYAESYGIPVHLPGPKTFYLCSVDAEDARGGRSLPFLPGVEPGKVTPCSYDFAKTCPLYYNKMIAPRIDIFNCQGE